jgi:hypothetical protein
LIDEESEKEHSMLEQHRENWVRQGFLVLQRHEPDFFKHANCVFDRWEYSPAKCAPGSWACTGGNQWGVLTFKRDPLSMSLVDLPAIIAHESLHYGYDWDGSLVQVDHACRDALCSHPADMLADPIYRAHRAVRDRLARKIAPVFHPVATRSAPLARQGWSTEKKLLVGVGVVAVAVGAFWLGPKVIGAMIAA